MPPAKETTTTTGNGFLTDEERDRRTQRSIANIRKEATFSPGLLRLVKQRISNNAFRRRLCENTLYVHIMQRLRDENLPEKERHPYIVDYLALEAMLPHQYAGKRNSSMTDYYERCNVSEWADKQLLEQNHHEYADEIAAAKNYLGTMLDEEKEAEAALKKQIEADLSQHYWRENLTDHGLFQSLMGKVTQQKVLAEKDVLTILIMNGGEFPPAVLKHLIYNQSGHFLHLGEIAAATKAFATEPDLQQDVENAREVVEQVARLEKLAKSLERRRDKMQAKLVREEADILRSIADPAVEFLALVKKSGAQESKAAAVGALDATDQPDRFASPPELQVQKWEPSPEDGGTSGAGVNWNLTQATASRQATQDDGHTKNNNDDEGNNDNNNNDNNNDNNNNAASRQEVIAPVEKKKPGRKRKADGAPTAPRKRAAKGAAATAAKKPAKARPPKKSTAARAQNPVPEPASSEDPATKVGNNNEGIIATVKSEVEEVQDGLSRETEASSETGKE